ncbi:choline dehydrogenase [Mesorhizobium soli]|uniref:GMC family oxidoreductase n=1 Tax=Pseudaminobacter soli (ex Li et al. 2025) TaxID=1295366 RepID=UPI002472F94E|nr:GMC family oxidoreductase N-terminal domain-containing protein [Mesorhizobium soli]MDH6229693.1 choline dehydrogenase [Mesorhizobium soli]
MAEFDYIVVGAGSAGCVLADQLSKDGASSVLVVEAGGSDNSFWIKTPIGYGRTFFNPRINWMYHTEADPETGGRKSYWPRGKVVGGSSSINALIYCRGMPGDFEDWRTAGAKGWGWDEVRSHYEAIESRIGEDGTIEGHGPLFISNVRREIHPSNRHYFAMAEEMGMPVTEDCNGPSPEGVTHYRITTRNGKRWSAADAFLKPALKRPNVTLVKDAMVERIVVEAHRATGVSVLLKSGRQIFKARKEVIVSAGSVNSPKLLQLSGIGPGALLRQMGIAVVHANDNVGGNLQDHLGINYYYKATEPTLNSMLSPWWGKVLQGARYVLTRRGPLSLSVNQCGGFVRSNEALERPDQQLYLNPVTYTTAPSNKRPIINPDPFPGFILSFQPTRPTSRGRIDIASPEAIAAPRIVPNYLSTQKDHDDVIAGGRLIQRMARTNAIRRFAKEAMAPDVQGFDDEAILEDFRERCGSVFHPVSTCRMGRDEATAVTDTELKVFGIDGLRVVDASAFPNITSGNTNAPTIMLAHRAASLILKDRSRRSA